jgi:DNA-binding transcriptional regulator GbsR (MarR family)
MDQPAQEFIERVGFSAESDGLPRIAGRLFGFLLLSPGPRSLDEIADALGVSKGSASTDARLLLNRGWLKRASLAGDRRDYYEMAPDFFAGIVAYRLGRWEALCKSVVKGRQQLPRQPKSVQERLTYLDEAQQFFSQGIHRLLDDWGEHLQSKRSPSRKKEG